MTRTIRVSVDVAADYSVTAAEVADIIQRLIAIGLEDAHDTIDQDCGGDLSLASLAAQLQITVLNATGVVKG